MNDTAMLDRDVAIASATIPGFPESLAPHRYRLTVADYHQLGEIGVFNENSRVELINGELVTMPPIGEQHASKTRRINQFFSRRVGESAIVDIQNPVALDAHSEPQPDIALLKPQADFYEKSHPRPDDVLLLIEISDSTLRYDREVKVPHYAKAGIPEVWVLDITHQRLEIYRRPSVDGYRQILYPELQEQVAPVLLPELRFSVEQLFITTPPV